MSTPTDDSDGPAAPATGAGPFDLAALAASSDPYAALAHLRAKTPVFFSPELGAWVVTRYADLMTILRDPEQFSSRGVVFAPFNPAPEAAAILQQGGVSFAESLMNVDPPDHTRLRATVQKAFTPRRIASLEPDIRAIAHQLIDRFIGDGQADLVQQFCLPLPLQVIARLMGMPLEDAPRLKYWTDAIVVIMSGFFSPEQQAAAAPTVVDYHRYILDLIARERATPGDNFTADFVRAIDEGQLPVSENELVEMLRSLALAGQETTVNALGSSLFILLRERQRWQTLIDEPPLIPQAVEELLRFDPPVFALFRRTVAPVVLGGVAIPQDARVLLVFSAANHDETVFADADGFDIRRTDVGRHIAFGYGVHFCLGAPLARLELQVALDVLRERLPGLRLVPGREARYRYGGLVRSVEELPVVW